MYVKCVISFSVPSIPQLDGPMNDSDDESFELEMSSSDGKSNTCYCYNTIEMKCHDSHCLTVDDETLFEVLATRFRQFDKHTASFKESMLFMREMEALVGAERLNSWLTDATPIPSPLHHPASPWRVGEGATTSFRTRKCLREKEGCRS